MLLKNQTPTYNAYTNLPHIHKNSVNTSIPKTLLHQLLAKLC